MGPGTLCRALLGLCLLLRTPATAILTPYHPGEDQDQEEDCSQPGIGCTIKNSTCLDFSWLHPYDWTPTAPASMAVTVGIGVNWNGRRVPMLKINWTVSIDSSILQLQGAELSVFEPQTNSHRCMQFQFTNQFPSQDNAGRPWQFYYDKFEVNLGQKYVVTVQHLPKITELKGGFNNRSMEVPVPGCDDAQMIQTDSCCDLGLCWFPNISLNSSGRNLMVEFDPRPDADKYGVEVRVSALDITTHQYIYGRQRSQRIFATFPGIGSYEDCLYTVSVWPDMASCSNDCIRQSYAPPCALDPPPPPEPLGRWYLWSAAALLTLAAFVGFALCCRDRICLSELKTPWTLPGAEPIPPPTKKKVWLVYSADHRRYMDAVIRLADFLQAAWGLDVVLDQHHVQKIGMMGAMAWLGHQKSEIEKSNGTTLILCSRGTQEKWRAQQNAQQQRVTLRADREHPLGDLFTPALALILPDFQRCASYDRYAVAYFDGISSPDDIPAPLEICPKYSVAEHLQELFFRIQRRERHQPKVQLSVCQEDHPSYGHLLRAMESCRNWQQKRPHWFHEECSPCPPSDLEDEEVQEEEVDDHCTKKVHPVIVTPPTDVSLVEPLLSNPEPTIVFDPIIRDGPPCSWLEPSVREPSTVVTVAQPLLQDEISPEIRIQEPRLAGEDFPIRELHDDCLQDIYSEPEPEILSREDLMEAQRRLFFGIVPEKAALSSDFGFMSVPDHELTSNITGHSPEIARREHLPRGQFVTPEMDQLVIYPEERLPRGQFVTPEMDQLVIYPNERLPRGQFATPEMDQLVIYPNERLPLGQFATPEMDQLVIYPDERLPRGQFVTPEMDRLVIYPQEPLPQVTDLGYDTMDSVQSDLPAIQREALKLFLQNGNLMRVNQSR